MGEGLGQHGEDKTSALIKRHKMALSCKTVIFLVLMLHLLTFAAAKSKKCTKKCPKKGKRWICASNGVAYRNLCQFGKAQCKNKKIKRSRKGVCGTNGKTYRNMCQFKKAQGEDNAIKITKKPVCANGRTFKNICQLKKAQEKNKSLKISHEGRCTACTKRCPRRGRP